MKNNENKFSKELFAPIVNYIQIKKYNEALILLDKSLNQNPDIMNWFKSSIYFNKNDWHNSFLYYQKINNEEKIIKLEHSLCLMN